MIDFSKYDIDVPYGKMYGQAKVRCKICSNGHGRYDKPLSLNFATGQFNCHRCGYKGIAIDNGKHWSDMIKPIPKQNVIPYIVPKEPSLIPADIYRRTMQGYDTNNFAKWLMGIVGRERAMEAMQKYNVGTSFYYGHYAAVFWYIDIDGGIRSGKVIPYSSDGHRKKKEETAPYPNVTWAHSYCCLNLGDDFKDNFVRCLYGERLLKDKSKTVAFVEAEKTAIVASIYLPEYIWVSCGGSEGMNETVCSQLRGRNVVFFPDSGQYDLWKKKAAELAKNCLFSYSVSSYIENTATEKNIDLADILTRYTPEQFWELVNSQRKIAPCNDVENNDATEPKSRPSENPVVNAMCQKNPALLKLMQTFDCEVTSVDTYEPEPAPMLTSEELIKLANRLPDHNRFSVDQLCKRFNCQKNHIDYLIENKLIIHSWVGDEYCRFGTTPF